LLKRTSRVAAIATAGVLAMAGPAMAHGSTDGAIDNAKATHGHDQHHQHGGEEGHIDVENHGTELVSKLELSRVVEGKIADVAVFGDYAYLAAWGGSTCKSNGVHIVDISDVSAPREIGFIPSKEGSYPGEGMQVIHLTTPSFTGDVLVSNNEKCKTPAGFGGMNLYDVTDPANPVNLAVGVGDSTIGGNQKKSANEIHSVFAWDAGNNAYAVMVDNEEAADVDIMDITNPAKPRLIAEYDLVRDFPQILQDGLPEVFLHDMVVKEIGGRQVMLLSYWDGGYVQLDVTDPRNPTYIGDTDFTDPDPEAAESGLLVAPEGNAHQAEYTADNRFVIAADEDFSPYALVGRNTTDGSAITANQGSDTTRLREGETISGQGKFAGLACAAGSVPPGDGTQIAVVERGECFFTTKVQNVIAAGGYRAVFIFNRTGSDACEASLGMSVSGNLPTFGVAPRSQGYAIFDEAYDEAACKAGNGTQLSPMVIGETGDDLEFSSYFDGWGYVHLYENEAGKMTELDTYAVDEAHDVDFATGAGDLSVHEVATSADNPNLAYLSYYAAGLRIIDVSSGEIEEVGAFIDDGGNNFWGVEVFEQDGQEYVALSDRDFGLYILKATP
jgi:hypothetical protein